MRSDSQATLRRDELFKPVVSARPFVRATSLLREADAVVRRRQSRDSGMTARVRKAANQAHDEELQRIAQELRTSLQALQGAATNSDASDWVRR